MGTLIRGVRVWDGEGDLPSAQPRSLLIAGGRIAEIHEGATSAQGHEVHDWPGAYLMPGLIDAHVHLWLDPEILSAADQALVSREQRERAMGLRALRMLQAGITTARDLGGPDGSEIALRERIASGTVSGPRLLCAGQPLTTRKGHCWFWGGEAQSTSEIEATVARQVAAGCDWIKVMATGGITTQGSSPAAAQYSGAQLSHLCAVARRHGRSVAAHAHGTGGIRNAAQARVDTVEHCSFVGADGLFGGDPAPEVVEALATAGTRVSPTINAGWHRFEARDGARVQRTRRALAALRGAGVPLIASTDAGIPGVRHQDLPRALPVFARFAGLTASQVLRSATSAAADALQLTQVCGRVAPGLSADLLVLRDDPTRDLGALRRPLAVFARGRCVPL